MASLLKSFLGRGELAELPEDLKKLIEQARREEKALGEAASKAGAAAQNFEKITAPLEETQAAIAEMKSQIAEIEQGGAIKEAVTRIASLKERAQNLARSHDQTTNSLAETLQSANDLDERMVDLRQLVVEVSQAKDDLAKLSGPAVMVTKINERIAGLRIHDAVKELREDDDSAARAS